MGDDGHGVIGGQHAQAEGQDVGHGAPGGGAVDGDEGAQKDPHGHLGEDHPEVLGVYIQQPDGGAYDQAAQQHGQGVEQLSHGKHLFA